MRLALPSGHALPASIVGNWANEPTIAPTDLDSMLDVSLPVHRSAHQLNAVTFTVTMFALVAVLPTVGLMLISAVSHRPPRSSRR